MAYKPTKGSPLYFEKPKPFDPLIMCRKCKRPVDRVVAVVKRKDGGSLLVRCHGEDGEVPLDMTQPEPLAAAFLYGQAFEEEQNDTTD